MGKISDALERYTKEKSIKANRLPTEKPETRLKTKPESTFSSELIQQGGFDPKLVTCSAPDSLDAENFKILRTQIHFPKNGIKPRTIMITSTLPGEGKTFVACNLAASIALGINEYVLLIDCDFRHPQMHAMLGISNEEGLYEYLSGKKKLGDLLIHTKVEKLSLLTAGNAAPNPSELLASTMMKEFLEEVKERYQDRYVIIDAPPSQVVTDTSILANYVDGIIFVIKSQKSPRQTVQKSIESLKNKILGIVFNGYSESDKQYGKYYKKYYR
jgi:protein-tyrosine kinase